MNNAPISYPYHAPAQISYCPSTDPCRDYAYRGSESAMTRRYENDSICLRHQLARRAPLAWLGAPSAGLNPAADRRYLHRAQADPEEARRDRGALERRLIAVPALARSRISFTRNVGSAARGASLDSSERRCHRARQALFQHTTNRRGRFRDECFLVHSHSR